jgi:hypothetical protein
LIPGQLKSTYILTSDGFQLLEIEASNSLLVKLLKGEAIGGDIKQVAYEAVEEEYKGAEQDLTALIKARANDRELVSYLMEVRAAMQSIKADLHINNDHYVRSVDALNTTLNRMIAFVNLPAHAPTAMRFQSALSALPKAVPVRQHKPVLSKLQWAMLGAFNVVVVGVCIAASLLSFGVLAIPSFMVASIVLSAAFKAATIGTGVGLVVLDATAGTKHYLAHEDNPHKKLTDNLSAIGQSQSALFASDNRVTHSPTTVTTDLPSP